MFKTRTHTIEDRIVSIHQPHVSPIVRGKTSAPVEFGAKIQVVTIEGIHVAISLIVNPCRNFSTWVFETGSDLLSMCRGDIRQKFSLPTFEA